MRPPPPDDDEARGYDEYGAFKPWPPRVIAAPKIEISVDVTPFTRAGCTERGGRIDCAKAPGLAALACSLGVVRNDGLGGLAPKLPILECWAQDDEHASGLYRSRGMIGAVRRFIVVERGRVALIKDGADFLRRFAPVTTPEAALSFAVALTDTHPVFEPAEPSKEMRIYTDTIEGTKIAVDPDGYRLNLFASRLFGCGIHPLFTVEVRVQKTGTVQMVNSHALYADPRSRACVD